MSKQLFKTKAILLTTSCTRITRQRQQQKNTFKISSDAVVVSPNKELSQLLTMVTPWSEHLISGQIQLYTVGNHYGFHQRFGQTSIQPRSFTKVLWSLQGQLPMVPVLILDLKIDDGESIFFLLVQVSIIQVLNQLQCKIPKCALCMFIFAR